ncbi:MAG: glyoxalase/bleomycin resistance/dioxygenase family protein [Burkholderiaceae bacterium]|nr:glyoxalase/bleomycin resistance/dioxygenase family protein [Burkholderiaceae bacterium]
MKRFHVHVGVKDLESSVRFYSALFDAEPTVSKPDYAKWMVDDPRLNFAISQRGEHIGVNHLGLQVDSDVELEALRTQAEQADLVAAAEKGVSCCYARGNKYWYTDPQGVAWETYHTLAQVEFFGTDHTPPPAEDDKPHSSCCAPVNTAPPVETERASAGCCR